MTLISVYVGIPSKMKCANYITRKDVLLHYDYDRLHTLQGTDVP